MYFLIGVIGALWLSSTGVAIYGLGYRKLVKDQTRDGQDFAAASVHFGGIGFLLFGLLLILLVSNTG